MRISILSACLIYFLTGCASTMPYKNQDYSNKAEFITHPDNIVITKDDISDRPYKVLKDIQKTYHKTTLFHSDPTPEHVNALLKNEASMLGADAIIFARYGTVGVSLISWGVLEGKGRAIKFID